MSRISILGIGSPSGDDQAGWLVIDALLGLGVQTQADLFMDKLDRPGVSLIPLLAQADWAILIDAMSGGPVGIGTQPGQIHHFDGQNWPEYRHGLSSHGLGVVDALLLARELGGLPGRLDIYGIEAGQVHVGCPAGEAIQASAQRLAARLAAELPQNSRHSEIRVSGR